MKELFSVMCCFLIMGQTAAAEDQSDAEQMIRDNLDQVILILKKNELNFQEKSDQVTELVSPMFDFKMMSMLSLGKRYWPRLSREQKLKFMDLFVKRLKKSYTEKLMLYTDEEVVFESSILVNKRLHVQTYLVTKDGEKISIVYKLYESKTQWRIYDIEIQGLSMIRSYQSDYHDILQNGDVEELFRKLEESLES